MQPSIEIVHQLEGTDVATSGNGVIFQPTKGNAYGEMNVRVTVPWLPKNRMPPNDGTSGVNLAYDYGDVPITTTPPSPIIIRYTGQFIAGTLASVAGARTVFQTDHPNQTLNAGQDNRFSDGEAGLQPGTWNIKVGNVVNGQLFDPTQCTIQIAAGTAGVVKVNRPSRSCQ